MVRLAPLRGSQTLSPPQPDPDRTQCVNHQEKHLIFPGAAGKRVCTLRVSPHLARGSRCQETSAVLCCEFELPSDSFYHQVLDAVQQHLLTQADGSIISVRHTLSLGCVSRTSCSSLAVHWVVLRERGWRRRTMRGTRVSELGGDRLELQGEQRVDEV